MNERFARIQLVRLEVDRLLGESKTCTDRERLAAIRQEMEVLLESMRNIRREQLMEQLNPTPETGAWASFKYGFWHPFRAIAKTRKDSQ